MALVLKKIDVKDGVHRDLRGDGLGKFMADVGGFKGFNEGWSKVLWFCGVAKLKKSNWLKPVGIDELS